MAAWHLGRQALHFALTLLQVNSATLAAFASMTLSTRARERLGLGVGEAVMRGRMVKRRAGGRADVIRGDEYLIEHV